LNRGIDVLGRRDGRASPINSRATLLASPNPTLYLRRRPGVGPSTTPSSAVPISSWPLIIQRLAGFMSARHHAAIQIKRPLSDVSGLSKSKSIGTEILPGINVPQKTTTVDSGRLRCSGTGTQSLFALKRTGLHRCVTVTAANLVIPAASCSFDQLIGATEQRRRHGDAEGLGCF
jgi:hypothetical protein